jgi:hypothetical protein
MHGLLDDVMVGAVLLASCVYALGSLGPRAVKRRLWSIAAAVLKVAPKSPGLYRAARSLEAAAAAPVAGSCGGCNNCGSPPARAGSSGGQSAAPEIRIPVAKIGRR